MTTKAIAPTTKLERTETDFDAEQTHGEERRQAEDDFFCRFDDDFRAIFSDDGVYRLGE